MSADKKPTSPLLGVWLVSLGMVFAIPLLAVFERTTCALARLHAKAQQLATPKK